MPSARSLNGAGLCPRQITLGLQPPGLPMKRPGRVLCVCVCVCVVCFFSVSFITLRVCVDVDDSILWPRNCRWNSCEHVESPLWILIIYMPVLLSSLSKPFSSCSCLSPSCLFLQQALLIVFLYKSVLPFSSTSHSHRVPLQARLIFPLQDHLTQRKPSCHLPLQFRLIHFL